MKNVVLRNITAKADELANQYNKTKDPSIRDQWYKLLKQVPKPKVLENERRFSKKNIDFSIELFYNYPIFVTKKIVKGKHDRHK